MASKGWIKLHRCFLHWEWWTDANMVKCFLWLLLNANTEDVAWHGITIKRGQLVTSYDAMSRELGMSLQTLRTITGKLVSTGEISRVSTNKYTIVTICNYDRYQDTDNTEQQASNKQPNKQATSNLTSKATNANINNTTSYNDVQQAEQQATGANINKQPNNNIRSKEDKNNISSSSLSAREKLLCDLKKHRILLEQFCMTEKITQDQFFQFADAILNEWDFTGEDYTTDLVDARKHLLSTIRIVASKARKQEQQRKRTSDDDNKYVNDEWKN